MIRWNEVCAPRSSNDRARMGHNGTDVNKAGFASTLHGAKTWPEQQARTCMHGLQKKKHANILYYKTFMMQHANASCKSWHTAHRRNLCCLGSCKSRHSQGCMFPAFTPGRCCHQQVGMPHHLWGMLVHLASRTTLLLLLALASAAFPTAAAAAATATSSAAACTHRRCWWQKLHQLIHA